MSHQNDGGRGGSRRTAAEGMLLPGFEAIRPNSGPSPALPESPSSSGYYSRYVGNLLECQV